LAQDCIATNGSEFISKGEWLPKSPDVKLIITPRRLGSYEHYKTFHPKAKIMMD